MCIENQSDNRFISKILFMKRAGNLLSNEPTQVNEEIYFQMNLPKSIAVNLKYC